jgi:hypothetical protein
MIKTNIQTTLRNNYNTELYYTIQILLSMIMFYLACTLRYYWIVGLVTITLLIIIHKSSLTKGLMKMIFEGTLGLCVVVMFLHLSSETQDHYLSLFTFYINFCSII